MDTNATSFEFGDFIELIKVNVINLAAISLSLTKMEEWIRLLGMIAALVYTTLKIIQLVYELKSKPSSKSQNSQPTKP